MADDRFVSLHRHSSVSLFDGLDLAVRAADRAAVLGQPALALTDHGTVMGLIEHARYTSERGVKPIMGCELYVVDSLDKESPRRHLTVLARDQTGYRNLMRLVTLAHRQVYYKPRVTFQDLEQHRDGLVVLSGCPAGHVSRSVLDGDLDAAEAYFVRLLDVFGDSFYAEVQHNEAASLAAPHVVRLAERYGVEVVATNDAHYVEREDRQAHDLLLKMRAGKGESEPTYGPGYHMMTRQEMRDALLAAHPWMTARQVDRMLDVTVDIANGITFKHEKPERMLPRLWGDQPGQELWRRAWAGLEAVVPMSRARRCEYEARLREELRVVEVLGCEEYFLLVSDIVAWGRKQGILIGPRGSVCGSLLAYVLGVTTVDPLVHGTMFERFLHDQKKSFPDIDLDVDSSRRDDLKRHVLETYSGYAYPIATFGRWGAGNVANGLAQVLDLSRVEKADLRAAIDKVKGKERLFVTTESDFAEFPVFRTLEVRYPGITRVVSRLYSGVMYYGRHPGGVCFVPGEPERWFAQVPVGGELVATGNFQDLEWCGLLKCDFLGLAAMQSLAESVALVKQRLGVEVNLSEIPLDDARVLERFAAGDTDGVFQFETRGAREILREIEPESFAEVAAATALNRPGVADNLPAYVAGKARLRRGK